jgi:hypothetical protein
VHDKLGRAIDVGDVLAVPCGYQDPKLKAVKVAYLYPGSDTCNVGVWAFEVREGQQSANAKDSLILLKADGTLPVDAVQADPSAEAPPAAEATAPPAAP